MDVGFCLETLEAALAISQQGIFNRDEGVQFTSRGFTDNLESCGINISMDGRGRVFDNIFIKRLWRSVKYEEVHVKNYENVRGTVEGLARYFFTKGRDFMRILDTGRRMWCILAVLIKK